MGRNKELQKQRQREWYQRKKQDPEWVKKRQKDNNTYKDTHKKEVKQYAVEYKKERPWSNVYRMVSNRCSNPKNLSYDMYGAKGIKNLLTSKDIKYLWFRDEAYKLKNPSIDRKDPLGNYELSNCRFIELTENISKTWFTSETGKLAREKQIKGKLG